MTTLETEGLHIRRRLLARRFVPYDAVREVEGRRAVLESGEVVHLAGEEAVQLAAVIDGPRLGDGPEADARALHDYACGRWSPRRAALALLAAADAAQASDVHVEPGADAAGVRLRVAGEVRDWLELPLCRARRLAAALKGLAGCLPYRTDIVQEGRIPRAGVAADVRASFLPTAFGERTALRLFGRLFRLDTLGIPVPVRQRLEACLALPSGLVLVAGPSGAGKTTTLYAAIDHVARTRRGAHLSIEDPIEQRLRLAGIRVDQLELCHDRGITGEAALVAALRQDVDVLAVGEVRTPAEASLAVKAAHTGRLVLAGLHAGSPDEAMARLVDLGVTPQLVTQTLAAVLSLRLRTIDCGPHSSATCAACGGLGRRRALAASIRVAGERALEEAA